MFLILCHGLDRVYGFVVGVGMREKAVWQRRSRDSTGEGEPHVLRASGLDTYEMMKGRSNSWTQQEDYSVQS